MADIFEDANKNSEENMEEQEIQILDFVDSSSKEL